MGSGRYCGTGAPQEATGMNKPQKQTADMNGTGTMTRPT
jgi:hypothetical protein